MTEALRSQAVPGRAQPDVRARGRPVVVSDLDLAQGLAVCAIAGRNGHGKSSLLRSSPPSSRALGAGPGVRADVADRPERAEVRRVIGYLGQHPSFPGSFRVEEALRYAA